MRQKLHDWIVAELQGEWKKQDVYLLASILVVS